MRYVAMLAVVAALVVPSAAFASSGTAKGGYGTTAGNIQGTLAAKPKLTTVRKSGSLPFTGQNLVVWLFAGVVLIAAGGGLVRYRGSNN
ncbi:MAG: LPXTG cell wall anchor domain-containing protein [Gaiellaceae bacterium]